MAGKRSFRVRSLQASPQHGCTCPGRQCCAQEHIATGDLRDPFPPPIEGLARRYFDAYLPDTKA